MGQDPDGTLREIAQIRARIDRQLDALGDTIPPADELKQDLATGLAIGLVAVVGVWFVANRLKRARQDRRVKRLVHQALREHASPGV